MRTTQEEASNFKWGIGYSWRFNHQRVCHEVWQRRKARSQVYCTVWNYIENWGSYLSPHFITIVIKLIQRFPHIDVEKILVRTFSLHCLRANISWHWYELCRGTNVYSGSAQREQVLHNKPIPFCLDLGCMVTAWCRINPGCKLLVFYINCLF